MKQQCESEAMAKKLAQLDAILRTVRRTLEGNESSIFMQDTVQLVAAASEITIECGMLRQKMDVQIYQKNSKYFQHTA
ncbi:hypothetical protein [Serratia liquefaciens]|uniref:hypothetical protein n=1 Tax=Serratia liquefaciens TaxID=614 RepID=UPI002182857A|nr:hypothetical protein [Serratia liquefaciens]CAI2521285.1 Uncharacterised protein [Serratia liquefaciens]